MKTWSFEMELIIIKKVKLIDSLGEVTVISTITYELDWLYINVL